METKGDTIARVRRMVKANTVDAFLTDRQIYSIILKYAKLFIKRLDDQNKLGRYQSIYQYFSTELITVSKVEAGCANIQTCCTFQRTKEKLPEILNGSYGPILRTVSSIDGSRVVNKTYAQQYVRMTNTVNFKYNKALYYWINDGYAYFPNIEWEAVLFDAMWENDVDEYKCCAEDCCVNRLTERTNIPDFLFADIESPVRNEVLSLLQIPKDPIMDNQNLLK